MRKLLADDRQGLKWQLAAAGDGDGWTAGATRGSYLAEIAGTGACKATKTKSPAACQKKIIEIIATFYYLS